MSAKTGISFIVPMRDARASIGAVLEHILQQKSETPFDHEIIVVDNGSKDAGSAIARTYPGVTVIREATPGRARARNTGARHAQYSHFAFVDADTLISENWAEQLFVALKKPFGIAQSIIHWEFAPGSGESIFPAPRAHFMDPLQPLMTMDSAAVMITREAFEEVGGFCEQLKRSEDNELTLRMLKHGHSALVLASASALKVEQRSALGRIWRAFETGLWEYQVLKAHYRINPDASLADEILSLKLVGLPFFQRLGYLFSRDVALEVTEPKGWRVMPQQGAYSQQLFILATPESITLQSRGLELNLALIAGSPHYQECWQLMTSGKPFFGRFLDCLKTAHPVGYTNLIGKGLIIR